MSSWDTDDKPEELFRRLTGMPTRRLNWFGRENPFREIYDVRKAIEKMFEESFEEMETKAPKDLVREYKTSEGRKVKEFGPIVYGYSMTIGPDGKPRVKEFGNVKPPHVLGPGSVAKPRITSEREPLVDVITTDKEVKVTVEMPGIAKENIKLNAYENNVEVKCDDPQRKYHRVIAIPHEADIETVKSSYKNGILEIIFKKKEQIMPKGKEIRVE
jgi:HSP20 family protein